MTAPLLKLTADKSALLVVDIQERLLPAIDNHEACAEAARRMIEAARVLELPILATEQYPAGLGRTVGSIATALGQNPIFEKVCFSACIEPVLHRLRELGRPMILVVGIEAHVCVQQTVLDLLREKFAVYVCADGVSSRRPLDRETALARMRQAGAIITTTESAIFELLGEAATDRFRQVLRIVK